MATKKKKNEEGLAAKIRAGSGGGSTSTKTASTGTSSSRTSSGSGLVSRVRGGNISERSSSQQTERQTSARDAGRQKSSRDTSGSRSRQRSGAYSERARQREREERRNAQNQQIVDSFNADPGSVDYFQYQMARDAIEDAAGSVAGPLGRTSGYTPSAGIMASGPRENRRAQLGQEEEREKAEAAERAAQAEKIRNAPTLDSLNTPESWNSFSNWLSGDVGLQRTPGAVMAAGRRDPERERLMTGYQSTVDRYESGDTDISREEYEIARDMLEDIKDPVDRATLGEWLSDVGEAAAKNTAGSYAGAAATTAEALSGLERDTAAKRELETSSAQYDQWMRAKQDYIDQSTQAGEQPDELMLEYYDQMAAPYKPETVEEREGGRRERAAQARQELYGQSAELMRQGAEAGELAKRGQGTVMSLLTDAAIAGGEMLGDVGVGTLTGFGNMAPMIVRSFGGGASQAAQNGGDINEQLYQGAKNAAIEWATEHIFGGNPVYDKGTSIAERTMKKVLGENGYNKLISSAAARIARVPASAVEEGLEEVIGDHLDPLADAMRNAARGEGWSYDKPDARDSWRSFGVGAILGGLGTGGSVLMNGSPVARRAAQDAVMAVDAVQQASPVPDGPALYELIGGDMRGWRNQNNRDTSESLDAVKRAEEAVTEAEEDTGDTSEYLDMMDIWREGDIGPDGKWHWADETPEAMAGDNVRDTEIQIVERPSIAERMQDLNQRAADYNARKAAMERRGQMGETVGQEEYDALLREGDELRQEAVSLQYEQMGEDRAERGETSPNRNQPENHIEVRDWEDMGNTRIKAFSFDHPELHDYYAALAAEMAQDAEMSLANPVRGRQIYSPLLEEATQYFSRPEVVKACEAIINDNGQENYALAKRLEIILDRALTNGYSTGVGNERVAPNEAYIEAKRNIQGARNEWQRFRDENQMLVALGEATEDEVRADFIRENPDLAWQVDGRAEYQTADDGPGPDAPVFVSEEAEPAVDYAEPATVQTETEQGAEPSRPVVPPEQVIPEMAGDGTRPTMPMPAMPMRADGANQSNARDGMDWANRVTWDTGNPNAVNAGPGTRQSKTYETVMNSETLTEGMRSIMDTDSFRAAARYLATTNQGDVDKAISRIRNDGYAKSMDDFIKDAGSGNGGSELAARGALLMKTANDMGRMRDFTDMYVAYRTMMTKAAQTVQAGKIIQKINNMVDGYAMSLTPADQVYLMRKAVDAYNQNIPNMKHLTQRQRNIRIEIDEGLVNQFLDAETDEERAAIKKQILDDLGAQAPASWIEKVNNWRYFSMLFNPRTHMKNIVGNVLSEPIVAAKDLVNLGLQQLLPADQRTTAQINVFGADRANYLYGLDFYDKNIRGVEDGAKWEEGGKNEIDRHKTVWKKNKALQAVSDFSGKMLDLEDVWHSKPAFARQLAREMKLNNITGADVEHGAVDAAKWQEMVDRAVEYSQKQTFREASQLSQFLNRVSNVQGGGVADTWNAFVNINLPFKRTPANLLNRAWQYSPAGLLQGIGALTRGVQNGKYTPAEAMDKIAQGVTGTGLLAIGYFLAKAGALTGGDDEDENVQNMKTLRGVQNHSFVFGDRYISAENAGIGSLPMLIGAELYRMQGAENDNTAFENFLDAMKNLSDPVFEMTMLSSVTDLLENLQYTDDDWLWTFARATAGNLAGQFFPTLGGAVERTFLEDQRNSTFTDRTGGGGDLNAFGLTPDMSDLYVARHPDLQYNLGSILNKVPGVEYNQIPYVDAWGRTQDTGPLYERMLNNFLNPAYMSRDRSTGLEDELLRIQQATSENVLPERASQSTEVNGHHLTGDEYVAYQTTFGQEYLASVQAAMDSPEWAGMDDKQRAEQLKNAKTIAKEKAKMAADPTYVSSNAMFKHQDELMEIYGMDEAEYADAYAKYGGSFLTNETTQDMVQHGATLAQWSELSSGIKELPAAGGGSVKDWQKLVSVSKSDMPQAAKDAYYRNTIKSDKTYDEWLDAKKSGDTMEQWAAGHYESYVAGSKYYVSGGKK